MKPPAPALAVFDVGGTTIRDSADVAEVFTTSLAEHALSPSPADIRRWRGAAKRDVITQIVAGRSGLDAAVVYGTFQRNLIDAFVTNGVAAIPGVDTAFATLRDRGMRIALTTGFDRAVMAVLLERLDWMHLVDDVITADDVRAGRPAPDMIREAMARAGVRDSRAVVSVGDTTNDLLAGAAAGVGANLGVLTGAHGRAELETVDHTAVLESAAAVPSWLSQNWGPVTLPRGNRFD